MERQQFRHRRVARAVLTLLTLLGLFGMHGLPDAQASPAGAAPMHVSAACMPCPRARPLHAGTSAHAATVDRSGRVDARAVQGAGRTGRVAGPMSCPMGHSGCVAVLRDSGHLPTAGAVLGAAAATPVVPTPAPVSNPADGPRAPPDISLLELAISRT